MNVHEESLGFGLSVGRKLKTSLWALTNCAEHLSQFFDIL